MSEGPKIHNEPHRMRGYKYSRKKLVVCPQEVVGPIYFMAIIIILKLTLKSPYMEAVLDTPGPHKLMSTMPLAGKKIVYAPNDNPSITDLMQKVEKALGPNIATFTSVANEDEILSRYEANFSSVYMGIVFDFTMSKDLRYIKALKTMCVIDFIYLIYSNIF